MTIAIVADDMTGALDAAAPFADPARPFTAVWRPRRPELPFAISTNSRDIDPDDAAQRACDGLAGLRAHIAFKKIDSQFRGNSLVELAASIAMPAFASVIVAPAFPAQGRVMRGGVVTVREREPAGTVDVAAGLARLGEPVRTLAPGDDWPADGCVLADAETDADLAAIVRKGRAMQEPRLWCGSAGLAGALPGVPAHRPDAPLPSLFVMGSRNRASQALSRRIAADPTIARWTVDDSDAKGTPTAASPSDGLMIDFALPDLPAEDAAAAYRKVFARLAAMPPPAAALVVGGDSLLRLVRALSAGVLMVLGQWAEGVAVCRVAGGPWDGTVLYTKSGSFDDAGLVAAATGRGLADAV